MPLIIAPTDLELTVIKILTDPKTKKHLENLGITINTKIIVLQTGKSVICLVKDGRLALDNSVATKILVA